MRAFTIACYKVVDSFAGRATVDNRSRASLHAVPFQMNARLPTIERRESMTSSQNAQPIGLALSSKSHIQSVGPTIVVSKQSAPDPACTSSDALMKGSSTVVVDQDFGLGRVNVIDYDTARADHTQPC